MDTRIKGTAEERKQIPIYRGFVKYFPDAIVEVTKRSMEGKPTAPP